MEQVLGCRWCDEDFELPSKLWDHVQRKHAAEFVQATTRPGRAAKATGYSVCCHRDGTGRERDGDTCTNCNGTCCSYHY